MAEPTFAPSHALYTAKQLRTLEQNAVKGELDLLTLMQRAGRAVYDTILGRFTNGPPQRWLILCGAGNNGGDGYVVAHLARAAGFQVEVFAGAVPESEPAMQVHQDFISATRHEIRRKGWKPGDYDVVVEALCGLGQRLPLKGDAKRLAQVGNASSGYKVSVDLPAGLDADTGRVDPEGFRADLCIAMIGWKRGMFTGTGAARCGERLLAELALPATLHCMQPAAMLSTALPALPRRAADSHKRSYGSVLISGGEPGMFGAALLSAKAALRSGSGLVSVMTGPEQLDRPAIYCPELLSLNQEDTEACERALLAANAVAVGPGLSAGTVAERMPMLLTGKAPLVVDAGALRWLAENPRKSDRWVLTPHAGEAAALLKLSSEAVEADRFSAAEKIQARYGGVCVLKGHGSIVQNAEGAQVCISGNPGLATAGTGDVLTGIIAALLGQGLALTEAAVTGVNLHATAGDRCAARLGRVGMIAGDLIDELPALLQDGVA